MSRAGGTTLSPKVLGGLVVTRDGYVGYPDSLFGLYLGKAIF